MIKVNCGSNIIFQNIKDFSEMFGVTIHTIEMWLEGKCKPRKKLGIKSIEYKGKTLTY